MSVEQKPDTKAPEASEQNPEEVATKPKKKDLPVGVVLAVLVVVLGIIGGIGYLAVFAPPPLSAEARERRDVIDALARKSGGDASKLSKEEMDKANALTHGFGAITIKDTAEAQGYDKK